MGRGTRGGRRASGKSNSGESNVFIKGEEREIETYYRRSGGYYGKNVIEAKSGGNGIITLGKPDWEYENSGSNTIAVKTKVNAGAISKYSGFESSDFFGINWENVKAVKGDTYKARSVLKDKGFKWDGEKKLWVK